MSQFVENISAAVDALGTRMPGVIIGIGLTDWATPQDRDDFLKLITTKRAKE